LDEHTPVLVEEVLEGLGLAPGDEAAALAMSMRRSGAADTRHAYSKRWVEKGACSRSTVIRRPSKRPRCASTAKCGLTGGPRAVRRASGGRARTRRGARSRVLFDLGVSSPQLDEAAARLQFHPDGPLDMRMDPAQASVRRQWLARASSR
jgi:hypothetical protein